MKKHLQVLLVFLASFCLTFITPAVMGSLIAFNIKIYAKAIGDPTYCAIMFFISLIYSIYLCIQFMVDQEPKKKEE